MSSAGRSGERTTISDADRLPAVPDERVRAAGPESVDTSAGTRVTLPTATPREHARLYADTGLHERGRAVDGPDDPLRHCFTSALSFGPAPASVAGPASVQATVAPRDVPFDRLRAIR